METKRKNNPRNLDPFKLVGCKMGRFQIVELIGTGGMGAVYHARHELNPQSRYALKILKPDMALANPEMADDFLEEARRTSNLDHPGIIRLLYMDFDEENQLPFFVMEWLNGRTLEQELEEHGRMSLVQVTELLDQMAEAVSYAHEQKLIHRDLKPGNIMLVKDKHGQERLKVLDFGIAKAVDATEGGIITRAMGAPYYASPEQLNVGDVIDRRSDIYSMGVTVYQMLTGVRPFNSESIREVIREHLNKEPPLLRSKLPEIPVSVEQVVLRALRKRPDERYQDAIEFARAFRQAAGLETVAFTLQVTDAQTRVAVAKAPVYLDRVYAGSTDEEGRFHSPGLNPGSHLLRVEAHKYKRREETINISPSREEMVAWELEPRGVGELTLRTNVPGAAVSLNGELKGRADTAGGLHLSDLPPGSFTVEVRQKRYKPFNGEVEVQTSQSATLEVELEKSPRSKLPVYILAGGVALACVALVLWVLVNNSGQIDEEEFAASLSAAAQARQAEEVRKEGDKRLKAGEYQDAEAALLKAVNLDFRSAENFSLLGEAVFKQWEKERKEEGGQSLYERAERAFNDASLLKPEEPLYRFKLGNLYLQKGEFRCAEHEYQMAMSLGPDRAEYHAGKGETYLRWWKYPQAVAEYEWALRLARPQEDAELIEHVNKKIGTASQSGREYEYERTNKLVLKMPPCRPELLPKTP